MKPLIPSLFAMLLTVVAAASDPSQIFSLHVGAPTTEEIIRSRVFEEPLVPIGAEPTADENAALTSALSSYSQRTSPDDFKCLIGFLSTHPQSPWRVALLVNLGLDYYNAAYYSLALEAWQEAWELGRSASDTRGKLLANRAVCELASLYSRLGRMNELEALLESIKGRVILGSAAERMSFAHEALWMMKNQPATSFRCGPLALQSIKRSLNPGQSGDVAIFNSASTQQGCSLPQVAELSRRIGLKYQMAFRQPAGDFVIPSVVHWKVGHYAALVRQVGDRYLLEDPTFGNRVWATKQALEVETSGYFLIPPGELPPDWRSVGEKEGGIIWGKGVTSGNDPDNYTPDDLTAGQCSLDDMGMAVSSVHLMLVNLQLHDTPLAYSPPVGPPVRFTVRFNHRDYLQPAGIISSVLGANWTHDWNASIKDNPLSPFADVKYLVGGGGARTFTDFDTDTQTFGPQQFDQTRLHRTGLNSYELVEPNGSKKIFGQRFGNAVLLTQVVDPAGNAVTLTYNQNQLLVALTDAIGQVTALTYGLAATNIDGVILPADPFKLTKVTDPFGRFATFNYAPEVVDWSTEVIPLCPSPSIDTKPVYAWWLKSITDVQGLVSQFTYGQTNGFQFCATCPTNGVTECVTKEISLSFIESLTTPYGVTSFSAGQAGTTRFVETLFPDGTRERVEFNQSTNVGIGAGEPSSIVPKGMLTQNSFLYARNTYYWSRNACATAYGDYTKARIYHWLHTENLSTTSGILQSMKEPLERRVWYEYDGQTTSYQVGSTDRPRRVGRVLDDTTTQLYSYAYNAVGHVTETVDPLERRFTFVYATNDIDLVEVRQTRGTNNEVLGRMTYNAQHRPLTSVDAASQTNTFTYNTRGQLLTSTNPKNETTTYSYSTNGYLLAVDGPLPGASDTASFSYDAFGRTRTITDESGYTVTVDYDSLDRVTKVTFPDGTFNQYTYNRLDPLMIQDRAGRQTLLNYDNMRRLTSKTDPLNRVTLYQWCSCGSLGSLTDPMGRTTTWHMDVQGRVTSKQYGDGSQVRYIYENATSRLRQVVDEKLQVLQIAYNRDNTLHSRSYVNSAVPTPPVSFTYDPDYERVTSMTDGNGTTVYSYHPIIATPVLGAGQLASVDGPLPNDTMTYEYDELGRPVSTAINGVASRVTYDAAGRAINMTNALGMFTRAYDGNSYRPVLDTFPNLQTVQRSYGDNLHDEVLQQITHKVGATPISEFVYDHDIPASRIATWSQQTDAQSPSLYTFGYDSINQLLSAVVTNAGTLIDSFAYAYDEAGNRLTEQAGGSNHIATYNPLNQLSTSTAPGASRTNEWDAQDRLVAVVSENHRTEFAYDGLSRLTSIRVLTNGVEASFRRLLWCGGRICEERDAGGAVTKRFFKQGMRVESGPVAGDYFYTRDHLGSIREVIDGGGSVRARYAYDPYGRRMQLTGDVEADFGFAGMFWSAETGLALTLYRTYDPELGRWLSRDPLRNAETAEGANLYSYVANDPLNHIDPLGLCRDTVTCTCLRQPQACAEAGVAAGTAGGTVSVVTQNAPTVQAAGQNLASCASRVAQAFDVIPQRLVSLAHSFEEAAPTLAQNYRDRVESIRYLTSWIASKGVPIWTDAMVKIDREFFELTEIIAARTGLSFDQSWNLLARYVGFNPDLW